MTTTQTSQPQPLSATRLMRRAHLLGDFLAVAADGSIRQAAERIAISQSALTRRIQDLEEELGTHLFERTARGMTLTPFGRVLQHHAQLVSLTCKYAVDEINDLLEGEVGDLRIAAGPAWAYSLVPDAIAAMHRLHPKIHVNLLHVMNETSLPMLSSGLLDVVLGGLPAPRDRDDQLAYEPLLQIEHLVFANDAHPLNSLTAVQPGQLCRHPWIWFTEAVAARGLMTAYLRKAKLAMPPPSVETSSVQSVFRLMQQGDYLMVLPSTSTAMAAHHGLRPLRLARPLGRFTAGMMFRPSVKRLKAFAAFRDALLGQLEALPRG